MKKIVSILLITLIMLFSLTACGNRELIGTWQITDDDITLYLALEKGGKGKIYADNSDKFEVQWAAEDGKIFATANIRGEDTNFFDSAEYEVDGDTLTVTTKDDTFTLIRKK